MQRTDATVGRLSCSPWHSFQQLSQVAAEQAAAYASGLIVRFNKSVIGSDATRIDPQRLEARLDFRAVTASLKRCPDTNPASLRGL
jgi:hypothetical protein